MPNPVWFKTPAPLASHIGWDTAAASNTLTLQPAGHTPGLYEIMFVLVVRTAQVTTLNATATWTAPTFGAENKQISSSVQTNVGTGTAFGNTNTTTLPHRAAPIVSTGATAITLQMSAGAGSAVIDFYACARLIAPL